MDKKLKQALQNLVITSVETGNENANYIYGNHCISIHEVGPLRHCRVCLEEQNGSCPYDNKLDCPTVAKAISKYSFFFQEIDDTPDPCNTDCWHYAHGTCPYRPKEKYQCPRYRLYED